MTKRLWNIVFAVLTVASALPFFATRYLPITDVPEHVAAIATMSRLVAGQGSPGYELALDSSQYILYDVVGALLTRVVGNAVDANRILLAIVAIGWSLSLRSLLRALGRDDRLAVLGGMLFWNRALVIGFLPFVASAPLAVFGVALVVRQCLAPSVRRSIGLAVLATALFYTHLSSWTLFVGIAVAIAAIVTLPRLPLRTLGLALGPIAPSGLLGLLWLAHGAIGDTTEAVHRQAFGRTLGAVPIWIFDIWRTHVDEFCAIAWWTAFAVVLVKAARPGAPLVSDARRHALLIFAPFACTLLVYLVTPFGIGITAYLNVRLAPLLALFAVPWLRPRKDLWGTGPLAVAAVAALVTFADAAYEFRRAADDMLGDFDSLLAAMKPGSRVLTLNFQSRSPRLHYYPYVYAGSYHRVAHEAVAFYSFSEFAHWPLHYVGDDRPPSVMLETTLVAEHAWPAFIPCEYRYRRDGAFYDYVLVQGSKDPFAEATIGPLFQPIKTAGVFTLYAKTGPRLDDDSDAPDRGPCPTTP